MYFFAERKDGLTELVQAYTWITFPYKNVSRETLYHGKKMCRAAYGTFDIETTSTLLDGELYGFMYIWQMCVDGTCVYGRTWGEWVMFILSLKKHLQFTEQIPFIIYVHNLSFEFQFIYQLLNEYFEGFEIFATATRKPLTVRCGNGLEFRCSYKLSNMSLYYATNTELGCKYIKADGDLDYTIKRYPHTPLTDLEFSYCMNDVLSLYWYIYYKLENDNDNLLTVPLTSTGYVRRDCRKSCKNSASYMKKYAKQSLVPPVYELLKEAGRGGDTGANRYLAGVLLTDVDSFDVTSSYPYQLLTQYYPSTRFYPYGNVTSISELDDLCSDKCVLFRCGFKNLRIKETAVDAYLPLSKALALEGKRRVANGRVLTAESAIYTHTELDWAIVKDTYTWDAIAISSVYTARRAPLPEELRRVILSYFKEKCELAVARDKAKQEGDKERYDKISYLYAKIKNKLNGIFGMCYTDPVRDIITFSDDEWTRESSNIPTALAEYKAGKNNFLVYAWGVWTTAHARMHLHKLINLTGPETIYWDTDSSKARITPEILLEINNANETIRQICREKNAFVDVAGKTFYLGVYEHETARAPYTAFKTLGAKKYAYTSSDGVLHATISGVAKSSSPLHPDGARELKDISHFNPGFVFTESGGLTLYYTVKSYGSRVIDGHKVTSGSGIAMEQSTYTLGITKEYSEIIAYNAYNML